MNLKDDIWGLFKKIESGEKAGGPPEFIIAGLGNPGKDYERTRHNTGFMAMDRVAAECGAKIDKLKFKSYTALTTLGGHRVFLMKPCTFMNLSGEAVTAAMEFYKIPIQNVIVVFDDTTLPVGKMRIRRKGSDGGHNGIKNIIYLSGSNEFPRVKLSFGQPFLSQQNIRLRRGGAFAPRKRPDNIRPGESFRSRAVATHHFLFRGVLCYLTLWTAALSSDRYSQRLGGVFLCPFMPRVSPGPSGPCSHTLSGSGRKNRPCS